jgi:hypothetical protein
MDVDDLAIIEAARARGVSVRKDDAGKWEVGPPPALEPLGPTGPTEPAAIISGRRIRFPDGQTFPLEMTTEEARAEFGVAKREE